MVAAISPLKEDLDIGLRGIIMASRRQVPLQYVNGIPLRLPTARSFFYSLHLTIMVRNYVPMGYTDRTARHPVADTQT